MSFETAHPSVLLSPFVKQFWAMEAEAPEKGKYVHRVIPNGLVELTFYFGRRPIVLDATREFHENSLITGQQKDFFELEISGELSMFSVSLKPHAVMALFNIPVSELSNQNVPLRYFAKDQIDAVEDMLFEAADFASRVRMMELFLFEQIQGFRGKYELARIADSIECINMNQGVVSIDSLASRACLSRKQFERSFLRHIGSSPKQFLKTVRFQHALYKRQTTSEINLGDLSFECGYYDQAHMTNEFKKLSGMTPGKFFAECEPFSDYFS